MKNNFEIVDEENEVRVWTEKFAQGYTIWVEDVESGRKQSAWSRVQSVTELLEKLRWVVCGIEGAYIFKPSDLRKIGIDRDN